MRLRLLATGVLALAFAATLLPVPATATSGAPVDFHQWKSPRDFHAGQSAGVRLGARGDLRVGTPAGTVEHTEPELGTTRTYDYGTWTSPVYRPGFDATQLVASWNATTPAGTWLAVELRADGPRWYTMGRWASGDADIIRTSVPDQSDAAGYVDVDTFVARKDVPLRSYQLRVTLYRLAGTAASPSLGMVGAMTSAIPDRFTVPASTPGPARGIELRVPRYSQNTHVGEYPQYGGGGEAWCSPTSTEMVVEYWGRRPSAADLAWVDPAYADPSVDHAARYTYDRDYDGTGNWPFNTAYAATLGLSGHVTRLGSLTELERYIARGIPVITSQSFHAEELDGAGYGTAGHLMVVIGFTADGDVIANDPASSGNAAVRRVYDRAQFENIWLRTKRYTASGSVAGGSGGVAYVITPPHWRLPRA
ncbi:peptidase C39 family protein [Actinokineospora sp.]|uniref:peptidase C39 family protein n=1 Tax=Actinokineospora sp. TaxID=1872133 RepID=UPI0040378BEC